MAIVKTDKIWRVYRKIDKQPWKPTCHVFTGDHAERDAKTTVRLFATSRRKHKAVCYVPLRAAFYGSQLDKIRPEAGRRKAGE